MTIQEWWDSTKNSLKKVWELIAAHPSWSLILFFLILLLVKIIVDLQHQVILVQIISVPEDVEDSGLSAEALTTQVQSKLGQIDSEVPEGNRGKRPTSFRGNEEKAPDFEIPGTKVEYRQAILLLQEFFGKSPTKISGEVLQKDKTFSIVLRVTEPDSAPFEPDTFTTNDADEISTLIAEHALAVLKPAKLANYLYFDRHREAETTPILKACIAKMPPEKKAECLIVQGDIASESDFEGARKNYAAAAEWDPHSANAMSGLGWIKYLQGNLKSAIAMFEAASTRDPGAVSPHHNIAQIGLDWGNLVRAREEAEEAVRISGRDPAEMALLALILNKMGDSNEATDLLLEALTKDPKNLTALDAYGTILISRNRYTEAAERWNAALAIDHQNGDLYNDWGLALWDQDKYKDSAEKFEAAIKLRPRNPWYRVNLAKALLQLGDAAGAEREFQEGLAIVPEFSYGLAEYARLRLNQNDLNGANQLWKRAQEASPASVPVLFIWADALRNEGNDSKNAYQKYLEGLKADPDNAYLRQGLAWSLAGMNRWREADQQFELASRLVPGEIHVLADWAMMRLQWPGNRYEGDLLWRTAREATRQTGDDDLYELLEIARLESGGPRNTACDFGRAIEQNSGSAWWHQRLANFYSNPNNANITCTDLKFSSYEQRLTAALAEFIAANNLLPHNVVILADWGLALARNGNREEAESKWNEALAIGLRKDYVYKQRATAFAEQSKDETLKQEERDQYANNALEEYKVAKGLNPIDPDIPFAMADLHATLNLWPDAKHEYADTLSLNPAHLDALWNLANVLEGEAKELEHLGNVEGAKYRNCAARVLRNQADQVVVPMDLRPDRTELKKRLRDVCNFIL